MNKFIHNIILSSIAIAVVLTLIFTPEMANARDCFNINGETIDANTNTRPFVCFNHDAHNEKAGVENCDRCHHLYDEQGKRLEGQSSEGQSCSECHAGNTIKEGASKINIDLAAKYHTLCRDCHLAEKKGPVVCGECHSK